MAISRALNGLKADQDFLLLPQTKLCANAVRAVDLGLYRLKAEWRRVLFWGACGPRALPYRCGLTRPQHQVFVFFDPAGPVLRCFPCRALPRGRLISRKMAADSVGFQTLKLHAGRGSEAAMKWSEALFDVRCHLFSEWIVSGLFACD